MNAWSKADILETTVENLETFHDEKGRMVQSSWDCDFALPPMKNIGEQ